MNPLLALKNGYAEKPFSDNARLSIAEFSNGLFDKTFAKVVLFLGIAMIEFEIVVLFWEWGGNVPVFDNIVLSLQQLLEDEELGF